ncbi:MAG TPA: hypothetical protein DHI91_01790, partial [Candidatus Portnoybacteria bacterium]|nr:hypothetical protein [Candidatus Portnoybacteria bacterium]
MKEVISKITQAINFVRSRVSKKTLYFLWERISNKVKKLSFFKKGNFVFVFFILIFSLASLYFAFKNFIPAAAVGTFSDDFATVDSGDALVWSLTGGAKEVGLNTEIRLEGTGAYTFYSGSAAGAAGAYRDLVPTPGAINMSGKQLWFYLYLGTVVEGAVENLVSNVNVTLYDDAGGAQAGNWSQWNICTANVNCREVFSFGWNTIKIYLSQPDTTSATPVNLSAVTNFTLNWTSSVKMSARTGPPMGIDFVRVGKTISFNGGTASNPVTFADISNYSNNTNPGGNPRPLGAVSISGNAVDMRVNVSVGDADGTATYFSDTDKYIGMNMANSDDKLSFTLYKNSTTTFGAYENGFAISGNTIAYAKTASTTEKILTGLRSTPFIFPNSTSPLPDLYLYASKISGAADVYFGTSTAASINAGNVYDTEIDNASTTYIYSPALQLKNVDIHHSTTSATSTMKIFVQPTTPYENVRIFASPTNALDIATTTGGPDQITLWDI